MRGICSPKSSVDIKFYNQSTGHIPCLQSLPSAIIASCWELSYNRHKACAPSLSILLLQYINSCGKLLLPFPIYLVQPRKLHGDQVC